METPANVAADDLVNAMLDLRMAIIHYLEVTIAIATSTEPPEMKVARIEAASRELLTKFGGDT